MRTVASASLTTTLARRRQPPPSGRTTAARRRPSAPTIWHEHARPVTEPRDGRLPSRADVVVVGGGIVGVATAYWLSQLGCDVLLLESRDVGSGASGRNAGLVLGSSATLGDVRAVLSREGIDAEYAEPGHLSLTASEIVLERMRLEVERLPPGASPLEVVSRDVCEELLRLRVARRFLGGRWMPAAGVIHPVRFVRGLADAAVRHGAVVACRTRVHRLHAGHARGWEVRTTRGTVRAQAVVLACHLASARLYGPLTSVLRPARGQVLATQPLPSLFRFGMAVDYGAVYWRQASSGSVVLGGLAGLDPFGEGTDRLSLNRSIQRALERFLPDAFPGLPAFRVTWRWAGIMDETPDGRPLVGAVPGAPGLWIAAGFGGHGLPPALRLGEALAKQVAGRETAAVLEPLDPARFGRLLAAPSARYGS